MQIKTLLEAFEPGDLLFGLENEARALFYQDLKNKLHSLGAKYDFVTIDEIVKPLEAYYLYDSDGPDPLAEQPSPIRNHGRLWTDSPEFTAITNHPSSPNTKERLKILLSDKIAIDNAPGKIHFCLDGFDLNHPAESFTCEELSHIATHYQRLRDKVIFYRKGIPVASPWDELHLTPDEWSHNQQAVSMCKPKKSPKCSTKKIKLSFSDDEIGEDVQVSELGDAHQAYCTQTAEMCGAEILTSP